VNAGCCADPAIFFLCTDFFIIFLFIFYIIGTNEEEYISLFSQIPAQVSDGVGCEPEMTTSIAGKGALHKASFFI
jgi:hypothetical protein